MNKQYQFLQIIVPLFCLSFISLSANCYEMNDSSQLIKDCEHCPQMIIIEPGEFMMGSPSSVEGSRDDERPQHQVHIEYFFAAGQYEVTIIEFAQFVQSTGHDMSGGCYGATKVVFSLGEI